MIQKEDYTDEEWAELITRCKVLTEGRVWVSGDLAIVVDYNVKWWPVSGPKIVIFAGPGKDWDPEEDGSLGYWASVIPVPTGAEDGCCLYVPTDKLIHIPSLGQLVRNEEWAAFWHTWEIDDEHYVGYYDYTDYYDCEGCGSTPELAALRAIQRCEKACGYLVENTTESMTICNARPCAGIHPHSDCNQRCLTHAMENLDGTNN